MPLNTNNNLPEAKFSHILTKDFFSENEEKVFFHLKDSTHEFTMGLKEVLLCIRFAEDEGLIPKAPEPWWSFLFSTYNVHKEQHSQNYKEGFHNGFWNAIELIIKMQGKNISVQELQEKYIHMNQSELLAAIDAEWES